MKLFLHWLRWDLCRFRLLLVAWALFVLGNAALIVMMKSRSGPLEPSHFAGVWLLALLFLMVEVFGMLYLLTTDAAVGPDLFWKTRPPSGIAVAGVKIAISLMAFLLLPVGALAWVMVDDRASNPGTWDKANVTLELLAGIQMRLLVLMAVGAAAVKSSSEALVRILVGMGLAWLLGGIVSCFSLSGTLQPGWGWPTYGIMSWLWLVTGICLFVLARWSSRPAEWVCGLVWAVPCLLLLLRLVIASPGPQNQPGGNVRISPQTSGMPGEAGRLPSQGPPETRRALPPGDPCKSITLFLPS